MVYCTSRKEGIGLEYIYEMHFHTSECSKCAAATARQMVQGLAQKGYAGGVMTNHFLGGNTAVPRALPWAQKMELYYAAFESGLQEAKSLGLDLFFGVEHAIPRTGKEFLTYGIDLDFLLKNPDLIELPIEEYVRRVHSVGGLVVQAHPFRVESYISPQDILPFSALDGIEVFNWGNHQRGQFEADRKAAKVASACNLISVAGSDAHTVEQLCGCGVAFDRRLKTAKNLIRALRNREGKLVMPQGV